MQSWPLDLQALIIELQAGSPTKENQPSSQHMPAASPPSGPQPAKAPGPSRPALAPSRRNAQHSSAANKQAAMRQQMEVRQITFVLGKPDVPVSLAFLCSTLKNILAQKYPAP